MLQSNERANAFDLKAVDCNSSIFSLGASGEAEGSV